MIDHMKVLKTKIYNVLDKYKMFAVLLCLTEKFPCFEVFQDDNGLRQTLNDFTKRDNKRKNYQKV